MNLPERNYATLDAIAVIGSLLIVAGILWGLFNVTLDAAVAPIVSSLATGILAIPGLYGAFRWGNSVGAKNAQETSAATAAAATGALAQIAGAGPPPPSQPLNGAMDNGTANSAAGASSGASESDAATSGTAGAQAPSRVAADWPWTGVGEEGKSGF